MAELSKLGRYELRRVLGKGAMGVVFEGFDPTLSRRVAVKTILKSVALDSETERAYSARFIIEAKAVARLNHPNIVQVHDFGVEGDVAYLVMEFIQGRELRGLFEAKEKFAPDEVVRIMGELLDALDFAHEAGVIHRDIKPANVMLDAQRRVKLTDFGVARVQESERSTAGTMVGTPAFMSPEQIRGGKIDRRTDIFSAGVVLYQLLTGEQPFKGDGAWTVARQIMQDDPPHPSSVVLNLSPAFDVVVNKALAKIPPQRFATAKDFATALRGALANPQNSTAVVIPKSKVKTEPRASETELEFWRAIQNSIDPAEFEFYLEQFPEGTYAQLARYKIAKLREPLEAARKEQEEKARLAAEAQAQHMAEEQVQRAKEGKARLQREAEERVWREAETKARREAAEKAMRDAAEQARREAAAKAKLEADATAMAKLEADAKAKGEAEERAKRAVEDKARQAQALARLKELEESAARAKAVVDADATMAIGSKLTVPPSGPLAARKPLSFPAIAAAAVIVAGIAAYLLLGRMPTPAPVAEAPPAPKAPTPKAPTTPTGPTEDVEKIRRETEARVRKEFTDKTAAEKATMEKAAAEKAATEKIAADKAAANKAAADKAAAEKAAAEKAAVDKAVAEKALAEKLAAEKTAADKAAATKAANAREPGRPVVGDKWIYEARETNRPEKMFRIVVEMRTVTPVALRDAVKPDVGSVVVWAHKPGPHLARVAAGILDFSPYILAFQKLRPGEHWADIEYEQFGGCSTGALQCSASARIVGKEKVIVKAGTFDAWKIVVELYLRNWTTSPISSGWVYITYWFSEDVNRLVKYQSERKSAPFNWFEPDTNMELVSYTPAGAR
jgi:membrane protein involved in colicin uptake